MNHPIVPSLWFDGNAEEAANFYVALFPDSAVTSVGPTVVQWTLRGQSFMGINGGPQFPFTEAVSFQITCETQEELDRYWDGLLAGGGTESRCGWLKDRFGLSWQVVPAGLGALLSDPDRARAGRATEAMMGMTKLDLAAMQAAADGPGASA